MKERREKREKRNKINQNKQTSKQTRKLEILLLNCNSFICLYNRRVFEYLRLIGLVDLNINCFIIVFFRRGQIGFDRGSRFEHTSQKMGSLQKINKIARSSY